MKMKRFVAAAIAAVSCLSFAACGSDTASKDENVIHIMSSGDSSANMERALVDEYNKTADVKAVLDLVTSADYQTSCRRSCRTRSPIRLQTFSSIGRML